MRAAHPCERSSWRSPGSRTESLCACQGLRPRRVAGARENAPSHVAFHVVDRVGTREFLLTRLNTWPAPSPTDASPPASRLDTHGLGANVDRCSFIAVDFHHLLSAGLPAHRQL